MEQVKHLVIEPIEISDVDQVTQLPGPLGATAVQVHAKTRCLSTDAGRVYVAQEARIMDMRNTSHSGGPRIVDLTSIQAGHQLLFYRLSTCPGRSAAFAAGIVMIMPPRN